MKYVKPALLVLLLFIVVAVGLTARSSAPGEPFVNMPLDQALAKARQEGKLVFVDFGAAWCPPCKMLNATTWKNDAVRTALRDNTIPLQIDVEEQPTLAGRYNVRATPTLMLLSPDGKVLHRTEGYLSAEEFLKAYGPALHGHPGGMT